MKCCGKIRRVPFCPQCGKSLTHGSGPLSSLLLHLDEQVDFLERQIDRGADGIALPDCPEWRKRQHNARNERLAKWTAWRDALNDLMGEKQT